MSRTAWERAEMLRKTGYAVMAFVLLASCRAVDTADAENMASFPDLQASDVDVKVSSNATAVSDTEMNRLIRSGIHQSKVSCIDFGGKLYRSECKIEWTINRSDPVRPIVTVHANLYVDGNLSQTLMNRVPNPNTQPRAVFIREVSEMMETFRARASQQRRSWDHG